MYNILLILTGGTIGSVTSNGVINVDENQTYDINSCTLTDNYYSRYGRAKVAFDIRRPLNVLSENMNPVYWNTLCRLMYREINKDTRYDGVIIAHGSDTLSYTSAMISIMFNETEIPLVLTAANHPLDAESTNGNRNCAACVDYICGRPGKGVRTIYEDNEGCINVYNAATICEADGYRDEYHDMTGGCYGVIKNGKLAVNPDRDNRVPHNACNIPDWLGDKIHDIINGKADMQDNVLLIRPYPGLRYDRISMDNNMPPCVLHWLYHAGTATTEAVNTGNNLLHFLDICNNYEVPVYIAPVKSTDEAVYASHRELIDNNVRCLYDINYESAYALLTIMYAQ